MEVELVRLTFAIIAFIGVIAIAITLNAPLRSNSINDNYKHTEKIFEDLAGNGTERQPFIINNIQELNSVRESPDSIYKIVRDIDAIESQTWNSGKGFKPIGFKSIDSGEEEGFTGEIRGNNHSINNLHINRPNTSYVGLIGYLLNGNIRNLDIRNSRVQGLHSTGMLVGVSAGDSTITNVNVSGKVQGGNRTGGLIGSNTHGGKISESYSLSDVHGGRFVGGFAGYNHYNGSITDSYSKSNVVAENLGSGGLVGMNFGRINNSLSASKINGNDRVGGLVGANMWKIPQPFHAEIKNSFSYSQVDGDDAVGAFVGYNGNDDRLLNQIEGKIYDVRIKNSYYISNTLYKPIGVQKGGLTELNAVNSTEYSNLSFIENRLSTELGK